MWFSRLVFSLCSYYRNVGSSSLWLGTLGTIYQKTQMNSDERREFYKGLRERILQLRMGHLFEEPCPLYEPGWEDVSNSPEDWHDFWEGEDA